MPAGESLPDGRWAICLGQGQKSAVDATKTDTDEKETADEKTPEDQAAPSLTGPQGLSLVLERAEGRWIPLVSDAERCFGLIGDAEGGRLKVTVLIDDMSRRNNLFKTANRTSLTTYSLELTATAGTDNGTWKSAQGGGAVRTAHDSTA